MVGIIKEKGLGRSDDNNKYVIIHKEREIGACYDMGVKGRVMGER